MWCGHGFVQGFPCSSPLRVTVVWGLSSPETAGCSTQVWGELPFGGRCLPPPLPCWGVGAWFPFGVPVSPAGGCLGVEFPDAGSHSWGRQSPIYLAGLGRLSDLELRASPSGPVGEQARPGAPCRPVLTEGLFATDPCAICPRCFRPRAFGGLLAVRVATQSLICVLVSSSCRALHVM